MSGHGQLDPLEAWAEDLRAASIPALSPERVVSVAEAATSAVAGGVVAAGTAAVAVAATPVTAKVVTATVLAAVLAAGTAAATGVLPGPIQRWVADIADRVGIHLPTPGDESPELPGVTIPGITVPGVTVPDTTLPTVDLP